MALPAVEWPATEQRIAEIASKRRGRHRNKELASWRRSRAIELRASGLTFEEIAAEVGYTSRATAFNVVTHALEAREAASIDVHRQAGFERLEQFLQRLWPAAMHGDVAAVSAVRRIVDAEARLLGLYARPTHDAKDEWDNCVGPPAVVLRPNDCRIEGCVKHGKLDEQPVPAPARATQNVT